MTRYASNLMTYNASTGAAEIVPDMIVPDIIASSGRQEVFMPHVRRFDFTGSGESFGIPQNATLDFASLGSQTYIDGTAPDQSQWNPTSRTCTPQFYYLDVTVGLDVVQGARPGISVQGAIAEEAGRGLAKHHDALFAALYTEAPSSAPDHEIGTDGTLMNFTMFRTAYALLLAQNAPRPYVWIIHPTTLGEILQDNTFTNAAVLGKGMLTTGVGDGGFWQDLLGIGIYVSDEIDESSGLHTIMMSKNAALAYGYKRITNPNNGQASELMVDVDWNSARRMYEINMTYQANALGAVFTSTTNKWMVDIIS